MAEAALSTIFVSRERFGVHARANLRNLRGEESNSGSGRGRCRNGSWPPKSASSPDVGPCVPLWEPCFRRCPCGMRRMGWARGRHAACIATAPLSSYAESSYDDRLGPKLWTLQIKLRPNLCRHFGRSRWDERIALYVVGMASNR